MSIIHAYSNQVADGTATSVVRPSDWNSAHVQQVTLSGNVVGQSSFSANEVVMQGGPNVTLSGIVAGALATLLVSAANPAAAYSLANSNGIIFGTSNGQVTASYSVPATYPQTQQPMAYAAGGVTKTANTLPFSNANGVSFVAYGNSIAGSVRTDYASSDVTTNALALSHSSLLQPVSNTSAITSAAMPLAGSTAFQQASNSSLFQLTSGMAAYQRTSNSSLFQLTSATSNITSNALHSTATSGITSAAMPLANSSVLQFLSNTSGITSAAIHTSLSSLFTGGGGGGGGGAAIQGSGTYSQNTGTVQFANSNGVTFGLSNNGVMTASVVAGDFSNSSLLAASDHDHGAFQLNMTNLSGSVTTQSNGLTINLSGPSGGGGGGLVVSAGTRSRDTGVVEFQNGNGVSFGMDGLGHLTASASSITFSNGNDITFGVYAGVVTASFASATDVLANHVRVWASGGHGTSTTVSATAVKFYDANNVSFGINSLGEFTATAAAYPISLTLLTDDAYGSQTFNMTDGMRLGKMAGGSWYAPVAFTTFSHLQGTAIGGLVANSALPMLKVNNMPDTLYGADRLTALSVYGANGVGINTYWNASAPNIGSISINGASLIRTDLSLALTNVSATKSVSNGQMTLSLSAGGAQYSLSGANGIYFTSYTSNSYVSISDGAALYQISVAGTNIAPSANLLHVDLTGALQAYVPTTNGASVSLGVPYPTLSLVNLSGSVSTQAGGGYVIRLTGNAGGTGGGGGLYVLEHTDSTDYNQVDAFLLSNPGVKLWDQQLEWNEVYAEYGEVGTNNEVIFYAPYGGIKLIALHTENASTYRNLSETIFRNRPIMLPLDEEEFRRMNPNHNFYPLNDKNVRIFVSGAASSNRSLGGTIRVGLYTAGYDTNGDLAWDQYASASEVFNFTASSQSSAWNGPMLVQLTGLGNTAAVAGYNNPRALIMFSPVSANATWFNLPIYGAPQIASGVKLYKDGATAAIGTSQSIAAHEGMYSTTTAGLPSVFYTSDFVATGSQHILRPWFEYFDPSGLNQ